MVKTCIKKCKGISRATVKNQLTFDDYKSALVDPDFITKRTIQYQLNHKLHEMYVNEVCKIAISPFDDKRYIEDNGITTKPWGFEI